MEENKSDQIVAKLHKISAQDITPARKIILSLPYICKLLTTEVGLKGTHHLCIVCGLAFLSMTVWIWSQYFPCIFQILSSGQQFIFWVWASTFIYSQDWSAVETLVLLSESDSFCPQRLSCCLAKPEKALWKEMSKSCETLNVNNLHRSLLWSLKHALATGKMSFSVVIQNKFPCQVLCLCFGECIALQLSFPREFSSSRYPSTNCWTKLWHKKFHFWRRL